jgi:hydrogenase maturation protease
MPKKQTVVLGIGNPLMSDDGVGIKIIESLIESASDYPDIDFYDAGTGGLSILHYLAGRKKTVIIDCAIMGTQPGTIKRFTLDDVETKKALSSRSCHEIDIIKLFEFAGRTGQYEGQIVFFAIEPACTDDGMELSEPVKNSLNSCIELIKKELSA